MQLITFLRHRNLLISKYIKLWVFFLTDIYLIYNIVFLRILNKELWTCPCPLRTLRFSFSLTLSLSKFVFISVISWDYVSKLGRATGRSASMHYQMHQPLVLGWRFGFLFLQHMRGCLSPNVCSWGVRASCFISYMLQLLLSRWVPEGSQDASPWGTHSFRHSAQDTWATLWVRGIKANIKCFWVLRTHTIHKNSVLLILQRKKQKGGITHPQLHGQPGWSRARIWIPFFLKRKSTVFLPNTKRPSIGRKWCSWPHLFLCWGFIPVHSFALIADWGLLSSGTWASHCKVFSCCSSQI